MTRVLHLISKSPSDTVAWSVCLDRTAEGDAIMLLGDAVYACHHQAWLAGLGDRQLYVLAPDMRARGLQVNDLSPLVHPVDFEGFVDLTVAFERIISW